MSTEQSGKSVVKHVFKKETFVGKSVNSNHVVNRDIVPKSVVTKVGYHGPGQGQLHEVFTRYFYNSAFDSKKSQGLLAKGNKKCHLKQWVGEGTSVGQGSKAGTPVLGKEVNTPCKTADSTRVHVSNHSSTGSVEPVLKGPVQQVSPITGNIVSDAVTNRGVVKHISPCEAGLHDTNVKQSIHTTGHGVGNNRCQEMDNGQSGLDSTVIEKVLNQRLNASGTDRCENVMGEYMNNVDTSQEVVPLFDIKWSSGDDKSVNTLFTKTSKIPSLSIEVQQLLDKWRNQTDFSFGFVPLSELITPELDAKDGEKIGCAFEMHRRIKHSGPPNAGFQWNLN